MRLQILLSTYDGERFLPELLDSLEAQSYQRFDLLVRDDGSTDGTLALLADYGRRRRADVRAGTHVGVPESFLRLLRDSDPAADLFGYCDQDDVWLPDKIARAVAVMARLDPARPALYCAGLRPVGPRLEPLPERAPPARALGFGNALVENRASGCTMVLNRAARALLNRHAPRAAMMHDSWAYLVVSAFGTVHYDPEPQMLYRQHPGNAIGALGRWTTRLRRMRRRGWLARAFAQADEFRALYGAALDAPTRATLDRFLAGRDGLHGRLRSLTHRGVYRQSRVDDLALRVLLALGLH